MHGNTLNVNIYVTAAFFLEKKTTRQSILKINDHRMIFFSHYNDSDHGSL
jgi:hypothetical protein